ncbi:hypothetical protein ACS0PU_013193 [Formica fusca]
MTTDFEDLKICHVNCQSLFAHLDEFYHFFGNADYHIICMSETWLRPGITDAIVKLPGYSLFRCDRVDRSGGGVAFYLSDFFRVSILCSFAGPLTVKPEFIAAEVLFEDSSKLLLAIVYRPPNSGYLNEFFQQFLELQVNYRYLMIFGDFNADMNQVTFDSQQLSAFISASSLHLVPFSSTPHLRNSSTLLDLCIIDDVDKLKSYGQHGAAFLSAHDLIYIRYGIKLQRRRSRLVVCRDWRDFDATSFQSDINSIDWIDLLVSDNLEENIEIFNAKLLDIFNSHVPLKR